MRTDFEFTHHIKCSSLAKLNRIAFVTTRFGRQERCLLSFLLDTFLHQADNWELTPQQQWQWEHTPFEMSNRMKIRCGANLACVCVCGICSERKIKIRCASKSISMGMEIIKWFDHSLFPWHMPNHVHAKLVQIFLLCFTLFSTQLRTALISIHRCIIALQNEIITLRALMQWSRFAEWFFEFGIINLSSPERKCAYVRREYFNFVGRLPARTLLGFFFFFFFRRMTSFY